MAHTIIINQLGAKRNRRFDADEIPFRVLCQPNVHVIKNIGDYIELVEDIMNRIMTAIRAVSNSDQDMVSVMIRPSSFIVPILTTWVRLADYNHDLVYSEIDKVYQSNKKFIFDEEFYVWGRIVRQPRGGARWLNVQNAAEARLKLKSIKRIEVENGWCMPASVWLAKQHVDSSPNYRNYRDTKRPGFLQIIKNYSSTVLGVDRDLGALNGASFDDLQKFQDDLGNDYHIKVFAFANPKREFLWQAKQNNSLAIPNKNEMKRINLMFDRNHFDVITKLGGFFSASGYCHDCNKCYHDVRTHRCVQKCPGCWRVKCPIPQGDKKIVCRDCNRSFRHQDCFDYHKHINDQSRKSLCQRAYYCKNCCRLIFQRGNKVVKHTCGEIHCKNCKSFVDNNHKCYMKTIRGVGEDDSGEHSDEDQGEIGEELARETERVDGVVLPPTEKERNDFKRAVSAYYDCEAYLDNDGEHVCNLIVVQWDQNEKIFRGDDAKDDFCKWALSRDHSNWTFVAHNAKRYDDYFIMNYLVTHTPCLPTIITSGGSTLLIKLNAYNVRFIDSCCFLPSALAKLPEIFGIQDTVRKGFFPHEFNQPANYDYDGPMPDKKCYDPDGMNIKRREEFDVWYAAKIAERYRFRFWEELIAYCKDDVRVLRECCKLFREQFFEITNVDPFTKVTLASACNDTYRKNFLPRKTIPLIPANGYYGNDKQSRIALTWLEWMAYKTGYVINHAFNGGEREVRAPGGQKFKLDGYVDLPNKVIAFEFYGCFMHGCQNCFTPKTFNTLRQSTMENLYQTTIDRENALKDLNLTVHSIWECAFVNQQKIDPELNVFLQNLDLLPPLQPRDAFFGGRTEGIKLHHISTGTEKLSYVDINSLYPWVQKTHMFPVGHQTIIRGDEIDPDNLLNYFGLIKCQILPPQNLYHSVLPSHIGNKLKFVLCSKCANDQLTDLCTHSEIERSLSGTWVSVEIEMALKLGYRIMKIFEVWHFSDKRSDLFAGYVKLFIKEKLQSKGYPEWAISQQQQCDFISSISRLEGVQLDPSKIKNNPGRLIVSKLCLNTLWGKFGQRNNLPQTKFIRNQMELWQMFNNERYDLKDIIFPSEQLAQVSFIEKDQFVLAGVNTNVVIAAFTTAYARLKLLQSIIPLDRRVCYMDTDSIIYIDPDPADSSYYRPPIGEQLGAYKDEIGINETMIEFTTGGPKNYGYRTNHNNTCLKVKGITLNFRAQVILDFAMVRDMVVQRDFETYVEVPMGFTVRREKDGWKLYTKPNKKKYRFHFDKRIIMPRPEHRTLPFGYTTNTNPPDPLPTFPLTDDSEDNRADDIESVMTDVGSYLDDSFVDNDMSN